MLYGSPAATFDVLQWAQNNLARVVCQRGGRTDARPLLRSLLAPLAASQASSDIQDGVTDVQDNVFRNASVLEQPDPDSYSSSSPAVIRRPAADCPKNVKRARSPGIFSRGPVRLELTTIGH